MKLSLSLIIIIFSLNSFSVIAGNDVYVFVVKKQEQKKSSRWSLGEWLLTKKKIALMDQWLALNSSSNLFEFYLGGNSMHYNLKRYTTSENIKIPHSGNEGELGIFCSIIGLEGSFAAFNEKGKSYTGQLSVRLLGRSYQGTHLSIYYGLKGVNLKNDDRDKYSNQYVGGELSLYILPFLGIDGSYKYYLEDKFSANSKTKKVDGYYTDVGTFLDMSFLRLYGKLFYDRVDVRQVAPILNDVREVRKGVKLGAKIFF